ncbi:hypothetical protein [Litchfieldella qijiaojingensis]|uniref:hypothetical protein n=1 Tax=Litchfieldella qijiaojingensis TaxID=980347 RepID=UPI0027E55657|nr:hypothetical protein [Halomonas qijiaojingensis]
MDDVTGQSREEGGKDVGRGAGEQNEQEQQERHPHVQLGKQLEVTAAGEAHRVTPGQMLWIPEGTELVYGGHALFGYALYPGNWKALQDEK